MFWMAGSVGELFGPIVLGLIAQSLGLIAVFQSVAVAVSMGALFIGALGALGLYRLRGSAPKDAGQHRDVDIAAGDDAHHSAVGSEPLQAGRH